MFPSHDPPGQVIADNSDGYPFYFPYVSYKKGTDMLVESQQYKLCLDLLDAGYTVYIDDIDDIIKQIETNLTAKYGGRALFGKPSQTVYQINI